MKTLYSIIILLSSCFGMKEVRSKPEKNMQQSTTSFYDFKIKAIDGKEIDFSMYKGKKVLLVNVASKCGYTPQYTELQELHQKYGDKVTVLGFPANNFGKQEPGTNEEIVQFCKKNYGVTFQMFEKISVIGDDQHPLYQWISDPEQNGWNDQRPRWNFTKYLINEDGELVKSFGSGVKPLSEEMLNAINK